MLIYNRALSIPKRRPKGISHAVRNQNPKTSSTVGAVLQPAERSNVLTLDSIQADPSAQPPVTVFRRKRSGYLRDVASALALAALVGCGNTYRRLSPRSTQ